MVATILAAKRTDYGFENIHEAGELGVLERINDKRNRIKTLINSNKVPDNEPILDSWLDIAGYAIIGYLLERNLWTTPYDEDVIAAGKSDRLCPVDCEHKDSDCHTTGTCYARTAKSDSPDHETYGEKLDRLWKEGGNQPSTLHIQGVYDRPELTLPLTPEQQQAVGEWVKDIDKPMEYPPPSVEKQQAIKEQLKTKPASFWQVNRIDPAILEDKTTGEVFKDCPPVRYAPRQVGYPNLVYLAGAIDCVEDGVKWRDEATDALLVHGISVYNPALAFRVGGISGGLADAVYGINQGAVAMADAMLLHLRTDQLAIGSILEFQLAISQMNKRIVVWAGEGVQQSLYLRRLCGDKIPICATLEGCIQALCLPMIQR